MEGEVRMDMRNKKNYFFWGGGGEVVKNNKDRNRRKIWCKTLWHMLLQSDWNNRFEIRENIKLLNGFLFSDIKLIKRAERAKKSKMPILIAIVRDEIERIPMFLEHYRKIGINHFVIADNGSEDGTLEYLIKEKDVDVFYIKSRFKNGRKEGWINKLLYLYGFHRWYLIADADELLEWPERTIYSLKRVMGILESKGINRAGALMVDMYMKGNLFENELNHDINNHLYFDSDSYTRMKDGTKTIYTGGPRKRAYNMECYLSKYPLVYLNEGELLISSHYWHPYNNFKDYPFIFALLHYKFLTPSDLKKIRQYVIEQNHVNNSYEYKSYLKHYNQNNRSLYDSNSVKFSDAGSLKKIKLIKLVSELTN